MKQSHETEKKKGFYSQKKTDKKRGHGAFLYYCALTVISTWTPKINITADHNYTAKNS